MAKSTHSQEVLTGNPHSFTEEEMNDPHPPFVVQRAMLGVLKEGDDKSVGSTSSESSSDEMQSGRTPNQDPHEPAQTMENPSDQTDEGDSDAPSTVGSGQMTEPARSARKSARKAPTRARSRTIPEDDEFD